MYNYVQQCLEAVSIEGLNILGQQGGYIDIDKFILPANADATNSDSVKFSPNSNFRIPYWWYLKSDNKCEGNCLFNYQKPNLYRSQGEPSIEGQLDSYITKKLPECIDNFETFREQHFLINELGKPTIKTHITNENVIVVVNYPIEVEKTGKTTLSKFFVRIPLNIKKIYELATLLTNLEAEYNYLEKDALNLIVGFSGADKEKLPPMSETEFKFGSSVYWVKSDVKQRLMNILTAYIQFLQVYNSNNYKYRIIPGNRLKEGLYNEGMLIPSNETFSDLDVSFDYQPWWGLYFDLNCDGELCKPGSGSSDLLPIIGIQRYTFAYDISFPVLVEIYDSAALNGVGYRFMFFLEANIRNNFPMKPKFRPVTVKQLEKKSMLCDQNKRTAGPVDIEVRDSVYDTMLDGVEVTYSCGKESCYIGKTLSGKLKKKFPVCMGGIISFFKDGYLRSSRVLNTNLNKEDKLSVKLIPLLTRKVEVMKKKLVKTPAGWVFRMKPVQLDNDEEALITLTRKASVNEEEYYAVASYSTKQPNPTEIRIAPGRYNIKVQLVLNRSLIIPESTRTVGSWWMKESYTIPEIEFNEPFPSGGLELDYTFTEEDLKHDKIIIYVVSPDIAGIPEQQRVVEDLEQIGKIKEYSLTYKSALLPKFE